VRPFGDDLPSPVMIVVRRDARRDAIARRERDRPLHREERLCIVGRRRARTIGQRDLVAQRARKPAAQAVHRAGPAHGQTDFPGQSRSCDAGNIDRCDHGGLREQGPRLHQNRVPVIDGELSHGRPVEPMPSRIPAVNVTPIVRWNLHRSDEHLERLRDHYAARFEESIPDIHQRPDSAFVQAAQAEDVGDDEVDVLGQLDVLRRPAEKHNTVLEAVRSRHQTCPFDDSGVVDGINPPRAGAAREEGKDARTSAQIEDGVSWFHALGDGLPESIEADIRLGEKEPVKVEQPCGVSLRHQRSSRPNRDPPA
jgi:hypothetical protein